MNSDTQTKPNSDTVSNNIADFLGTPNSVKEGLKTQELDLSVVNEQNLKDIEITSRAEAIYEAGNALSFMEQCCLKLHPGKDKPIITGCILSFAATYVTNSFGIHINVTGEAGSGKSHAVKTVLKIIPDDRKLVGHFSDKALFYKAKSGELREGTVISMDDQELSDTANDILKAQTSEWNEPYKLYTVIDKKSEDLVIPPRCPRWITKCDTTGDEQTADRQLSFFADNSEYQKNEVRKQMTYEVMNPKESADDTEQKICKVIWGLMSLETVEIPYANRIKMDGDDSNRNFGMLYSLIMSSCVIAAGKEMRKRNKETGCLIATEDDFEIAAKLMNPLLAGFGGSQKLKLNPKQQILLNYLRKLETGEYAYQVILDELGGKGFSSSDLSRSINGFRNNKGKNDKTDGLLKIPGIHICNDTYGTRRNEKYLSWNKEVFEQWEGSRAYITLEKEDVYQDTYLSFRK